MNSHSFFRSSTTTTTTTTTGVKDQQSPTQWVEIIEPKSKEKMYANLQTGNCVWDPPEVKNFCVYFCLYRLWNENENESWNVKSIVTFHVYENVIHETTHRIWISLSSYFFFLPMNHMRSSSSVETST